MRSVAPWSVCFLDFGGRVSSALPQMELDKILLDGLKAIEDLKQLYTPKLKKLPVAELSLSEVCKHKIARSNLLKSADVYKIQDSPPFHEGNMGQFVESCVDFDPVFFELYCAAGKLRWVDYTGALECDVGFTHGDTRYSGRTKKGGTLYTYGDMKSYGGTRFSRARQRARARIRRRAKNAMDAWSSIKCLNSMFKINSPITAVSSVSVPETPVATVACAVPQPAPPSTASDDHKPVTASPVDFEEILDSFAVRFGDELLNSLLWEMDLTLIQFIEENNVSRRTVSMRQIDVFQRTFVDCYTRAMLSPSPDTSCVHAAVVDGASPPSLVSSAMFLLLSVVFLLPQLALRRVSVSWGLLEHPFRAIVRCPLGISRVEFPLLLMKLCPLPQLLHVPVSWPLLLRVPRVKFPLSLH